MTEARIILAGGGDERDSQPLDALFAHWTGEAGRLLYLPIALDRPNSDFASCLEWLRGVFQPLGVCNITMWTDLRPHDHGELDAFTSIYIGGGNTFHLLNQIRSSAFDEPLRHFIERGGAVYGGSAGAIIFGCNILTCAHMDEDQVGLTNISGLDLVHGHAFWCHYEPSDDARIHDFCRTHRTPVLAMSERAGLRVEGERLAACGYEPVFRFEAGQQVIRFAP